MYKASIRVQRRNGLGSFLSGLFRFVKPLLYSGAKAVGREVLNTGSNILTDMLNNDLEQPVGTIFNKRFSETICNLEQKIKNMTGSGFTLKRKRKSKKVQSLSKLKKVKDIFTEKSNGILKIGA
jgi:hypothetical protein